MKRIILKVKYFHKKDMVNFLAERLALAIQANQTLMTQIDKGRTVITYVPSHRYRRIFIKGYNQSQLLARAVAKQTHISCLSILKKRKNTKSQAQLNKVQRNKNLENAFQLYTQLEGNETIMIVDDVTTTGATLNTLAKTIKSSYPKTKIRGIVLCRHRG
jgi:ComF family protein